MKKCLWLIVTVISIAMIAPGAWARCTTCSGSDCVKTYGPKCCKNCGGSRNCGCPYANCPQDTTCAVCSRRKIDYNGACNKQANVGRCSGECGAYHPQCDCKTCIKAVPPPCYYGDPPHYIGNCTRPNCPVRVQLQKCYVEWEWYCGCCNECADTENPGCGGLPALCAPCCGCGCH